MSRRSGDPLPGILARFDGVCPRCDKPVLARQSRIVLLRGRAIHVGCASGGDDE